MADTAPANGGSLDSLKGNAQAAYDQIANGPVVQNVKDQSAKTGAEISNLAASRQTPSSPAATGQPLTHYHSFFSELLSWNNPRATGAAYGTAVAFIFAVRYLDVLRYLFKFTWISLSVTVLAEAVSKGILGNGIASQLRPRKYYTISRDSLDALIGDVHELVNFFVIESQRIFFTENIWASAITAFAAFLSYYLVKIVPYWGLALVATTLVFFVPLVYSSNQEIIDEHLKQAQDVINSQTEQLRQVASKHTHEAAELTKQYMGDYTAKAQQMLRGRSTSPQVSPKQPKESDFPAVPKEEFVKEEEPVAPAEPVAPTEPVAPAPAKEEEEEPLIAA